MSDQSTGNGEKGEQMRRALAGDAAAFWSLVRPHERAVFAVALGIVRDAERAHDVLHDVYVRAFSTLGNLRSHDKLGSWLCSMARNIAHEHQRREMKQDRLGGEAPTHLVISVPDLMIREEEFEQMELAMAELPEVHRIVLGLKYTDNMSCKEIAAALEIGVEAAKSRLFEARKALRARMAAAQRDAVPHNPRHLRAANTDRITRES